jgi:Fe-S-cluster-containing hydrogenase component 2
MHFDDSSNIAFKCEFCGGDPECVKVCAPGALRLVTGFQIDPAHQCRVAAVVEHITDAQSS